MLFPGLFLWPQIIVCTVALQCLSFLHILGPIFPIQRSNASFVTHALKLISPFNSHLTCIYLKYEYREK